MSQPVPIENDAVRMEVWPQFGGKVSSLVDKADRFELLFDYPAEFPSGSQYGKPYSNGWYAGWDECFPAIAPGRYPAHPYDGVNIPDHGEIWGLPTTAVPTRDGITTVWHGLRFGYRLTRKLFLDGASVHADYTLINLAPFEFRFVWAMHALMNMHSDVEFVLPDVEYLLSHDSSGSAYGQRFRLDDANNPGGLADLRHPGALPAQNSWKIFSASPIEQSIQVRYPARGGRSITLAYLSEDSLPGYWGIWLNTGAWMHHRHFAIEPTTGRSDELDRAIADGSAGRVGASGRVSWRVSITLAPA
jgi:hypothetical protein